MNVVFHVLAAAAIGHVLEVRSLRHRHAVISLAIGIGSNAMPIYPPL